MARVKRQSVVAVIQCPCCEEMIRLRHMVVLVNRSKTQAKADAIRYNKRSAKQRLHDAGRCEECAGYLNEREDRRPDGQWRWKCRACRMGKTEWYAMRKRAKNAGETSHSAGVRDPHRGTLDGKTETDCAGNATRPLTPTPDLSWRPGMTGYCRFSHTGTSAMKEAHI